MIDDDPAGLIASIIDGRMDAGQAQQLSERIAVDPVTRRALQQHLVISEFLSQAFAPERSPQAFWDGLVQKYRSEQDADAFTARVMQHVHAERSPLWPAVTGFLLEVAGMACAALLLIGLLTAAIHALPMAEAPSRPALARILDDVSWGDESKTTTRHRQEFR